MDSTGPKPFVFVLMPFGPRFDDTYRFGIKGAAEDAEAYAERVDDQYFVEGILDRIFNQINKADVIVADMTGRNPNVFYEVGYAHALDKIVLLTTQNADDIPFDLKHRPHTVYGGSIETLRKELGPKIRWAIGESEKRQSRGGAEQVSISIGGVVLPQSIATEQSPELTGTVPGNRFDLSLYVRNDGVVPLNNVSHVYLFAPENAEAVPGEMKSTFFSSTSQYYVPLITEARTGLNAFSQSYSPQREVAVPVEIGGFKARQVDAPDGLTMQYRLPVLFSAIPAGAIERGDILFVMHGPACRSSYRLRLHTADRFYDFGFRLNIRQQAAAAETASSKTS